MLHLRFLQQWFGSYDPSLEEAALDVPLYRGFAGLDLRPGKCKALDKTTKLGALTVEIERVKARIRAKGEYPFRVIKRQFGLSKVRYRGLKENTAQIATLFALAKLWMARCELVGVGA